MMDEHTFRKYMPVIFTAAEVYAANLLNKQFLFIGRNIKNGDISCFEAMFAAKHFAHLTGIKPKSGMGAEQFFKLCIEHKLKIADVQALPTGQSALKADVILPLMKLPYSAKMFGDYNHSGNFLYTEKLSGTIIGCMGFVYDFDEQLLVANTVLKSDIRSLTDSPKQIVAVYQKNIGDERYSSTPVTCAKPLRGKQLIWPDDIMAKLK